MVESGVNAPATSTPEVLVLEQMMQLPSPLEEASVQTGHTKTEGSTPNPEANQTYFTAKQYKAALYLSSLTSYSTFNIQSESPAWVDDTMVFVASKGI